MLQPLPNMASLEDHWLLSEMSKQADEDCLVYIISECEKMGATQATEENIRPRWKRFKRLIN